MNLADTYGVAGPSQAPPREMSGAGSIAGPTAVAVAGRSPKGRLLADPVLLLVGMLGVAVLFGYVSVTGRLTVGKG